MIPDLEDQFGKLLEEYASSQDISPKSAMVDAVAEIISLCMRRKIHFAEVSDRAKVLFKAECKVRGIEVDPDFDID